MPIDLNALLPTLIEETFENLDDIDESLLTLDIHQPDHEKINNILRALHTIKGNSNIFHLTSLGALMHTIENLMSEFQKGTIEFDKNQIELILQSSDSIRKTLKNLKTTNTLEDKEISQLDNKFKEFLNNSEVSDLKESSNFKPSLISNQNQSVQNLDETNLHKNIIPQSTYAFQIHLQVEPNIFKCNLKPEYLFDFLKESGKFEIKLDNSLLPNLDELDPMECYCIWDINLITHLEKKEVIDVLSWVFNDKNIIITNITDEDKNHLIQNGITNKAQLSSQPGLTDKEARPQAKPEKKDEASQLTTIRVSSEKIDILMGNASELLIIESILKENLKNHDVKFYSSIIEQFELFEKNLKQLQENVLTIRMVPIAFAINRFPRMVFEISNKLNKEVDFVIKGSETEIDKAMIEKIVDPLLHLIRNAIDHGIEPQEIRKKLGKPSVGHLEFESYHESDNIVIELKDDGAGIDPELIKYAAIERGLLKKNSYIPQSELLQIIFKPGFTTKKTATDLSGRGVGLNVVEKNIRELGGSITVHSEVKKGTTFIIKLPLTLAIIDAQILQLGNELILLPIVSIVEMSLINLALFKKESTGFFYNFHETWIPLLNLNIIFQNEKSKNLNEMFVIIIQKNEKVFGILCDDILAQQPVVILTLEENFIKVPTIAAATIMGDGSIKLILDVLDLCNLAFNPTTMPTLSTQHFFYHQLGSASRFSSKNSNKHHKKANQSQDTTANEYLCFILNNKQFGINMRAVREISLIKTITYLPFSPHYLLGVLNFRSSIIPVVDLRLFFNMETNSQPATSILIVVQISNNFNKTIGLIVDSIYEIRDINNHDICDVPSAGYLLYKNYIKGLVYIKNRLITLLDINRILSSNSTSNTTQLEK